eukprot:2472246-Lingulodinium_polyedra.AAC.1
MAGDARGEASRPSEAPRLPGWPAGDEFCMAVPAGRRGPGVPSCPARGPSRADLGVASRAQAAAVAKFLNRGVEEPER